MKKVYVGPIRDYSTPDDGCSACGPDGEGKCLLHSTITAWRWATLDAEGTAASHAEAWAAAEAA